MTRYVALLRAVNVSGTGKLPMGDLKAMAETLGFAEVRTYIASGNLLFSSALGEAAVKARLEDALATYAGKSVPVFVRTAEEIFAICANDPFPDAIGARYLVYFFDAPVSPGTITDVKGQQGERIVLGTREIHVDYGANIRDTKLKFSALNTGTGRNMNTVKKLAALLA